MFRHSNSDYYLLKADRNIFDTQRSIVLKHHAALEISMEKRLGTDRTSFPVVEPYRLLQIVKLNKTVLN
jgi:hypothetical protein